MTGPGKSTIQLIDLQAQRQRLEPGLSEAIQRVLDHGKFIMGPEIGELEAQLSAFCGARHAITCSSGTDALLMALMAQGVGKGDAVFVPAFSFAATAEVVVLAGATPFFVDVRRDTFNMCAVSLEAAIEAASARGLNPAVLVPVDLFGQPADYRTLLPIAKAHDLFVLCDAAQSFGASLDGNRMGSFGDATAFSFFPAKPLGCYGDGGAVMTDDDDLADRMRSIRVHGKGTHKYDNVRVGLNARLDTIQAAILLEKLKIFEDEIEKRQAVAERYGGGLGVFLQTPAVIDGAVSAWAQYTILLEDRDEVAASLREQGVPTAVYYPMPLDKQTAYRDYPGSPGGTPNCDYLSQRVLSLPMHPYLTVADMEAWFVALRSTSVVQTNVAQ